jgi:hypothetical protein
MATWNAIVGRPRRPLTEPIQLQRDPFARATLMRTAVPTTESCTWCGSTRRGGSLFAYRWRPDDRTSFDYYTYGDPLFCSVDCWRTYNS